jgi:hypothetical protein
MVGTGTVGNGRLDNGSKMFDARALETGAARVSVRPRPISHPMPASLDVATERPRRRE